MFAGSFFFKIHLFSQTTYIITVLFQPARGRRHRDFDWRVHGGTGKGHHRLGRASFFRVWWYQMTDSRCWLASLKSANWRHKLNPVVWPTVVVKAPVVSSRFACWDSGSWGMWSNSDELAASAELGEAIAKGFQFNSVTKKWKKALFIRNS